MNSTFVKKLCLTALVGAFIGLCVSTSAHAVTYAWSYVGDDAFHNGSGTLVTDASTTTAGPTVNIIDFDGSFAGAAITALLPTGSIGGNDNLLLALSPSYELDGAGVSFIAGGTDYNIYRVGATDRLLGLTSGVFTVSEIAQTPLPAALPLFVTGLGGLGLIRWRRKRKIQANA
jgi:hypothetical protein